MTDYLTFLLGGKGFAILPVLLLAGASWSIGGTLLRFLAPGLERGRHLAAFVLGLDLFAFLFCAALQLVPGQGTVTAVSLLFAIAGTALLRKAGIPQFRFDGKQLLPYLVPMLFALFFASFAFVYPSGWDDCVYQLAVPRRWAETGHLTVYRDLPYSGFPMLPQMLYTPLMFFGGIASVRMFYILSLIIFYMGFTFWCRRFGKTAGILLPLGMMLSLTGSLAFRDSYAELFIALNLLAAFRIAAGADTLRGRAVLSGICAGAMTAVKLSGALPAICFFLYVFLKERRGGRLRFAAVLILTGFLFAGVFYLRPLTATGNPCYPYLAKIFTPGAEGLSTFHHALGTARFGYESPVRGFLLSFGTLSLKSKMAVFDGSWGLVFLFWCLSAAGALLFFLRSGGGRKRIPALFLPVLLFYAGWYLTSPQARFLMPGFVLAAVPGAYFFRLLRGRVRRTALLLLAGALLLSADVQSMRMSLRNWNAILNRIPERRLDLLYGRTGGEYLTACAMLRGELPSDRGLLLFEERSLYMPPGAAVGTPYFQEEYFRDKDFSADAVLRTVREGKFRWILFHIPEYAPDLLPETLQSCAVLRDSLGRLASEGRLTVEGAGENYWIFRPAQKRAAVSPAE